MGRTFDELIAEADSVPVEGWDFSWLNGRATEERPSWGYQRLLSRRLANVSAALDIHTGGGEVLAGAAPFPPGDEPPLPFADHAFDLVTSRHPVSVWWSEIARVLRPGGSYFAQHIGPATMGELVEYFIGPQPQKWAEFHPDAVRAQVAAAGLRVVDVRMERLRAEFFDIGAVVYFLRKVIWTVPDFSVARYRDRLAELHERIESQGLFVAHPTRVLVEARKPE